jgi:hypothetical protein
MIPKQSIPVIALAALTLLQAPALFSQSRPTEAQLFEARGEFEITFTLSKPVYFTGELLSGTITVKNPTSGALTAPKIFHPGGDGIGIMEIDPATGDPILRGFGSAVERQGEVFASPYPLETLASGASVTYTFPPPAGSPKLELDPSPVKAGRFALLFLGRLSLPFEVVDPPIEAITESKWPEQIGGDPNLGLAVDPLRDIYRRVYSLRWNNKSFVCLDTGMGETIAARESSYTGSTGMTSYKVCYAESTLAITRIEATHDGAKNLTVDYFDTQQVRRTFRVDANLNLLP